MDQSGVFSDDLDISLLLRLLNTTVHVSGGNKLPSSGVNMGSGTSGYKR